MSIIIDFHLSNKAVGLPGEKGKQGPQGFSGYPGSTGEKGAHSNMILGIQQFNYVKKILVINRR